MKKITSLILALILVFSTVSATDLPDFFSNAPLNYTADYTLSMSLENTDNLIALLQEVEISDKIENYVDIKALLESLLSSGVKMNLQADMSSDFRQAKIAITGNAQYDVIINSNLELDAKMKMGMWVDMNLRAETPVFKVIYSNPMLNKYMVVDVFETIPDDETKAQMLKMLDLIFSKEYMDSIIEFASELYAKYAEISLSGSTCTVTIKNDGLIGIMKELIPFITETANELIAVMNSEELSSDFILPTEDEMDLSFLDSLKILGEKGITYKYSLLSGKISHADMTADISIDIESMYVDATGNEWPYEADGLIDLTVTAGVKMSKYGTTTPKFPELTDKNSFTLESMISEDATATEEYIPEYPNYFVWATAKELPVINGEYYVPLRAVLENAYDETVSLTYSNGVVTAASDNFPGFTTIKFTKDSTVAYTDGKQISVSKVIIKDGTTYVGCSLFENTFGWELGGIVHYVLDGEYEISFYTETY